MPRTYFILSCALAASLAIIGLVLAMGVPPNHLLGVRTPRTLSDPELWRSANGGVGMLVFAFSCLVFYGSAAAPRLPLAWLIVLAIGMLILALAAAAHPEAPARLYAALSPIEQPDAQAKGVLALAAAVQLVAGAVGILLWKGRGDAPHAQRAAGMLLYGGSALAVAFVAAGALRAWPAGVLALASLALLAIAAALAHGLYNRARSPGP